MHATARSVIEFGLLHAFPIKSGLVYRAALFRFFDGCSGVPKKLIVLVCRKGVVGAGGGL